MEVIRGNLYDYPQYYDLVFGSDWKAEFRFLTQCFEKYIPGQTQHLFEPACGTGRLLFRLADSGFQVQGLDINARAVAYCNERLTRKGHAATVWEGDMTDFELSRPVDAAFNTINSFRHLTTDAQARAHLRCMAASLRTGGIYVLGLHLTPLAGLPTEEESWSARRGHLCVNTRLWTTERDLRKRRETFRMTYDVYTPSRQFQLADMIEFRTYTAVQFAKMIDEIDGLQIAAMYDFAYDIDSPVEICSDTEDVVYVLQKR